MITAGAHQLRPGFFVLGDVRSEGVGQITHRLAIDQGTTSAGAILFDTATRLTATFQEEFPQNFPQSGRVENC
jgi:hypothetical protein